MTMKLYEYLKEANATYFQYTIQMHQYKVKDTQFKPKNSKVRDFLQTNKINRIIAK